MVRQKITCITTIEMFYEHFTQKYPWTYTWTLAHTYNFSYVLAVKNKACAWKCCIAVKIDKIKKIEINQEQQGKFNKNNNNNKNKCEKNTFSPRLENGSKRNM